jgi:dienelactone hydrolase
MSLPSWARDAPDRCLYLSNASGTVELYAWDRGADSHRKVTDRPNGTALGALDPSGSAVWWFADADGDEFGIWMCQPFGGGADVPAVPGLRPAYPAGLALGRRVVVVGQSTDDGSTIVLRRGEEEPTVVYGHPEQAEVAALSSDETLLAIAHSEHGDAMKPALRVLAVAGGSPVAQLWDGPGRGLDAVDFCPVPGDQRVLVLHEREGRRLPLLWNPVTGVETRVDPDLPGEISADWYADGTGLLLAHQFQARTELYRYDLVSEALNQLDVPAGTVTAATCRPDGTVEYAWSDAARPPQLRVVGGGILLRPPGAGAPPSVAVSDVWAEGPSGRVHALLALPAGAAAPYPAVFLLHGGPMYHDTDSFAADRAAWVDAGFAVVQVNYRGSTGYGSDWQDAILGRPGLTELEDVAAIRDRLIAEDDIDRDRLVLAGASWGGYLTLLGLGTQPDAWALGVAAVPVADYVRAYEEEMEGMRAIDRALFGGSPAEVPDGYAASSPITYADRVRAPVLIFAGANDPRCPIGQVESYLRRLVELGRPHEVYRFDAGHGSLVMAERVRQMAAELDFAARHLANRKSG